MVTGRGDPAMPPSWRLPLLKHLNLALSLREYLFTFQLLYNAACFFTNYIYKAMRLRRVVMGCLCSCAAGSTSIEACYNQAVRVPTMLG